MTKPNAIQILIAWLAVTVILTVILCSCSVHKNISQSKSVTTADLDYLKDSMLQVQKELAITYEKKLDEARKNKVEFAAPCPTMPNIDSACNHDSLVQVIRAQNDLLQSMQNEIEVNADGSFKAKGRIQFLNTEWKKSESEKSSWENKYDSLYKVHSEEKAQVVTVTEIKDKIVKRTFIPWWVWLICAGVLVVGWKLGKIKFV